MPSTLLPQYQKHYSFATSGTQNPSFPRAPRSVIGSGLRLAGILLLCWLVLQVSNPALLAQANDTGSTGTGHLYLRPGAGAATGTQAAGRITLHTHTVDIRILSPQENPAGNTADQSLPVQVEILYRLQNPGREPVSLVVGIAPLTGTDLGPLGKTQGPATNIILQADGRDVVLQPSLDGPGFVTQVTVPGDGRLNLALSYRLALGSGSAGADALTALAYPVFPLELWPGTLGSLRMSIFLPQTMLPESWLRLEPAGWTFDGAELRWLYENQLPPGTFVLQSVHPTLWQEINNARRLAVPGADTESFLALAAGFQRIYTAPNLDDAHRRSFYAQALAAYNEGIVNAQALSAPSTDIADLHAGLAELYRTQAVGVDGRVDPAYVALTVSALKAALAAAPAGTPRHSGEQLQRWLLEALRLQLAQALATQAWDAAGTALDDLAALPASLVDPATIQAQRRAVVLQRAVQLLNQGNQAAAIALAGPEIARTDLAAPDTLTSPFHAWQVTMTVEANGPATALTLSAGVVTGREDRAISALQGLAQRWQDSPARARLAQRQTERGTVLDLSLTLGDAATGPALAQTLLASPDWALLRALLTQAAPQVQTGNRALWQEIDLAQRLDLRPAADQWLALAGELNSQAAQLESTSAPSADSAGAEQLLQNRIRAANYRAEAQIWQNLLDRSQVFVTLTLTNSDPNSETPTRSWVIVPQDPPATMHLAGRTLDHTRLLLALGGLMLLLILLAALLWRLM